MPGRFRIQAPEVTERLVKALGLVGRYKPHLLDDIQPVVQVEATGGPSTGKTQIVGPDGEHVAGVSATGQQAVQLVGSDGSTVADVNLDGSVKRLAVETQTGAGAAPWRVANLNFGTLAYTSGAQTMRFDLSAHPGLTFPCAIGGFQLYWFSAPDLKDTVCISISSYRLLNGQAEGIPIQQVQLWGGGRPPLSDLYTLAVYRWDIGGEAVTTERWPEDGILFQAAADARVTLHHGGVAGGRGRNIPTGCAILWRPA